ncbi:MAG: GNAT family N-acetyltransferase [Candidatus Sumerlaeia bacterium]|nr:GNAT family N-acetyltransferase [Candidatus Sumerlaeia bacterium]
MPALRFIQHGSPEYKEELDLREAFLHRPLGIPFLPEYREGEEHCWHLGAFGGEGSRLLGTVQARFVSADGEILPMPGLPFEAEQRQFQLPAESWVKIAQMVVHPEYQKGGLGRALMQTMEAALHDCGTRRIFLNARAQAIPFYQKLGYIGVGQVFMLKTIPHLRMEKGMV